MSLWKEILVLGAQGRSGEAREMIALDLRKALCELQTGAQGGASYRGLLPMVVRRFGVKLPEHEQALFQAWEQEFIDYLLDDVLEGVAKPLSLIELCLAFPNGDGL